MSANAARCTLFTVALLIGLPAWAGAPPVCLDPGDQWSWAHPMPHGHSGQVVRWIPERGEFVAMGDAVLTTTDGVTWTPGHVFAPWMVMDFHWDGSAFVAVAVDVSLYNGKILRSTDLVTWTDVHTGVPGMHGVAWNGTRYVAVGIYGTILTSVDGVSWSEATTGSAASFLGVAWSGSQFAVVGSPSAVMTSSDGLSWTNRTAPEANQSVRNVVWNGSEFVAFGLMSEVWASADGVTWEARSTGAYSSITTGGFANGELFAIGPSVDFTNLYRSVDGMTWSRTIASGWIRAVASNGVVLVGVGESGSAHLAGEGVEWIRSQDPFGDEDIRSLTAHGGLVIAGTSGGVLAKSTDHGMTWEAVPSVDDGWVNEAAWNGSTTSPLLLAVRSSSVMVTADGETWTETAGSFLSGPYWGSNGRFLRQERNGISSSLDGATWDYLIFDSATRYRGMAHAFGMWIAAGADGSISTSTDDGATWTPQVSGTSADLWGVYEHDGSAFVWGQDGTLLESTDGIAWSPVTADAPLPGGIREVISNGSMLLARDYSATFSSDDGRSWNGPITYAAGSVAGIGWDGTSFVSGGRGVASSRDGYRWTPSAERTAFYDLRDVAWNPAGLVAVGLGETLMHSVDGVSWTGVEPPEYVGFSALATDGARFVAVGDGATILSSDDGLVWDDRSPSGGEIISDVTHGDHGFVAVGYSGRILHSIDGVTWEDRVSGTTDGFSLVAWTGQRYVAVTWYGTVVTSLDGVFWQVEPQIIPSFSRASDLVQRGELTVLVGRFRRTWLSSDGGRSWTLGNLGDPFAYPSYVNARLVGTEIVATVGGRVEVSTDGLNWTPHHTLTGQWVEGLTVARDDADQEWLVVVGRHAQIQRIPLTGTCPVIPDPNLVFIDGFEGGDTSAWQ
jgi:hypothetical protein